MELKERTPLNLFVTAADSALGLALVRGLVAAGHKVSGLASTLEGAKAVRAQGGVAVYADLARASELRAVMAMAKADAVVNAAPAQFIDAPFTRVNFDGESLIAHTEAIVSAAKEVGAKYLIQLSYSFIYGNRHGEAASEGDKISAETPIQKAALKAERIVTKSEIPYSILRLGFVYGANSPALRALEATVRRSLPVAVDEATLNWIHQDDAAEAVRRVAEGRPANEIFNAADDVPQSSLDFLGEFCAVLGVPSPKKSFQFIARVGLSAEQLSAISMSVDCNTNKIHSQLGWTPHYATHRQGIEQVMLTWRAAEAITE